MSILPFLKDEAAFDPNDVRSMSMAFDDVCEVLKISEAETQRREVVAYRIIEIARRGGHSPTLLRDRVLKEAGVTISKNYRAAGQGPGMSPIPLSHYSGAFGPEMAAAMAMGGGGLPSAVDQRRRGCTRSNRHSDCRACPARRAQS